MVSYDEISDAMKDRAGDGDVGYVQEPVAIVGMACRFPGDAESPSALWEMLENQKSAQGRVPRDRFNINTFYHPELKRPGSMPVDGGYFINEDFRSFDAAFFGIRSAEATAMDPQHRKMLEVVYECMESSGLTLNHAAGSLTGVYMANFARDYNDLLIRDSEYPMDYKFVGTTSTLLSNRVSHVFDLKGPSSTVDTACSSSMYALHSACSALQARECTSAFVGGASLIMAPDFMIDISKSGVLSNTSTCHTFDESADGYARADGVAALYVKLLADAVRDGDPIRAVIRSTAVNSNGKTAGITHPSREGQRAVIQAAYKRAGDLDPLETSYVECHGTGTPVGDPLEVSAIADVFSGERPENQPLLIGSVKTNIGHAEPAAAVAGIIKTALALEKGRIPATIGIKRLTSKIEWQTWNIKVVTETTPWPEVPVRRASVNSFGYGGANSHTVLEAVSTELIDYACRLRAGKYMRPYKSLSNGHSAARPTNGQVINGQVTNGQVTNERVHLNGHPKKNDHLRATKAFSFDGGRKQHLLCFSAHDEQTLKNNMSAIEQVAEKYDLGQLAYNLAVRRSRLPCRGYAIANVGINANGQPATILEAKTVAEGKCGAKSPQLAFVFTGQGAQWAQMGRQLLHEFPCFRNAIIDLDCVLSKVPERPGWKLEETLQCPPERVNIDDPSIAQPLCTALQVALVVLLRSWGAVPTVTIGHSSGEIAAAFAAGRLSAAEAIVLAYYRGLAVKQAPAGSMMAVGMGPEEAARLLEELGLEDITVACHNSPHSATLSGDTDSICRLKHKLTAAGHFARELKTGRAYHSSQMVGVGKWYIEMANRALQGLSAEERETYDPRSMVSTVSGQMLPEDDKPDVSYWRKNLESPVLFSEGLETLLAGNSSIVDLLVEIGPHKALSGPIREVKKKMDCLEVGYLPTLIRNQGSVENMLETAGQLFLRNFPLDLETLCPPASVSSHPSATTNVLVDLPSFRWNHSKTYWNEPRYTREWRLRSYARHDILGSRVPGLTRFPRIWRNVLRCKDLPWLEDHKIGTAVIFPAAGYICMAVEAAFQVVDEQNKKVIMDALMHGDSKSIQQKVFDIGSYEVLDFRVKAAMNLTDSEGVETFFDLRPVSWTNNTTAETLFEFKVTSVGSGGDDWSENAVGKLKLRPSGHALHLPRLDAGQDRWTPAHSTRWYDAFQKFGLNYGPTFRGLSDIAITADGHVDGAIARAQTSLNPAASVLPGESTYNVHPATLDTCLHLAFVSLHGGSSSRLNKGYLPVFAERVIIFSGHKTGQKSFDNKNDNEYATVVSKGRLTGLRSLSIDSQIFGSNGKQLLDIQGFRCLAIEAGPSASSKTGPRYPFSRLEWKPDISLLDQPGVDKLYPASPAADQDAPQHFRDLETVIFLCMTETVSELSNALVDNVDLPHIKPFWSFVVSTVQRAESSASIKDVHEHAKILKLASSDRKVQINTLVDSLLSRGIVDALLVKRIFENVRKILTGELLSIDILLEDDLWAKFYIEGLIVRAANEQLYQAVDLLSHKKPNMKILEVGAGSGGCTKFALDALHAFGQFQRYQSYMFTDVSAGFFPAAQQKFQSCPNIEYRTLDIGQSPEEQGYTPQEYDLVIAANVLHATPNLTATLQNVRSLLKPGGKLLLVEGTREMLTTGWIFGTFPGWWQDDGRVSSGGFASKERWQHCLLNSGFTGLDLVFNDYPPPYNTISTMLSTVPELTPSAALDLRTEDLYIISGKRRSELGNTLAHLAIQSGRRVQYTTLQEAKVRPGGRACLLADLERSVLLGIAPQELGALKKIAESAQELCWVTTGATYAPNTPERAMSLGFARAIRAEYPTLPVRILNLVEVDDATSTAGRILAHLDRPSNLESEQEQAVSDGITYVERLVPDEETQFANSPDMTTTQFHAKEALKVDIETVGLLDTIYFKDDKRHFTDLDPDHVEIKVAAVGMNMKDVLNMMGHVDQHYFSLEAAGTVTRVGSQVKQLKPGDRVICLGQGHYGTFTRTHHLLCQKLSPEESFTEMATMPVVYCTVWYCLCAIAKLQRGETILIHSAAGGVGIAAIQLAQHLGAEVFATVGSKEKREYLKARFGLSDDHIFSSRDTSFKTGIMTATNGRGVDVTLNSTINEMLHETFSCLAVLGRHVDIVNRDIHDRGNLGMHGFDGSRSFTFFYLGDLMQYRPSEVHRVLGHALSLYRDKKIMSIQPIRTYDIGDLGTAMRYFSEGKHMGKVVITYDDPESVVKYKPSAQKLELNPDASYLLVGGLGGLGQSLAFRMLERGAKHFIFMSPSGTDKAESKATVESLQNAGATVSVLKGDVANAADVREAIGLEQKWPIRGVVHAAMVLKDNFIANMSADDFNSVCAPKVFGALNLHEALQNHDLDFFVVTSSISGGISGWQGQSNYGAANTFLDSFARYRNSLGLPALSVNLGVIHDIGYVSKSQSLTDYLNRSGFYGHEKDEFLDTMELALRSDQQFRGQLVLGFEPAKMRQKAAEHSGSLSWTGIPRLSIMAAALQSGGAKRSDSSAASSMSLGERLQAKRLADGDAEALKDLGHALTARFADILALSPADIDEAKPLSTYGMDSMLAAELRTWLFKQTGTDVALLEILQPTFSIRGMKEKVWAKISS